MKTSPDQLRNPSLNSDRYVNLKNTGSLSRIVFMLTVFVILKSWGIRADWPQFRGPDGQGHSDQKGIPLDWEEGKNITWKTEVPGQGWSSPVIAGNQVWMTSAEADGKSLSAVCIDKTSGKDLEKCLAQTHAELRKHVAAHPEVIATSSEKGIGIETLRAHISTQATTSHF